MTSQNHIKVYIIAALALVVGAGYWYFSIYRPGELLKEFQVKYKVAFDLHHDGRLNEAIEAFTKLSEEAPTIGGEIKAKLKLAFDLFQRNQGDDRVRSAGIYKELALDNSINGYIRARTISDFMDLYNGSHDNVFARDVIFKGEPFEQYLEEAKALNYRNDVDYAMRRAYEFAESLYPLSLAEFRIAAWYFGALDSGRATEEQKPELIAKLEEWTVRGEKNLSSTLKLNYEPSKVAFMHMSNALNRRALARNGIGNYLPAEQAFERALAVVSKENDVHSYILGNFIRYHYAAYLADRYGEARTGEIAAMLGPVYATPPQWEDFPSIFDEFLRNEVGSEHDTHGHKKDLVVLSKLVPEFKSYLDSRGISY